MILHFQINFRVKKIGGFRFFSFISHFLDQCAFNSPSKALLLQMGQQNCSEKVLATIELQFLMVHIRQRRLSAKSSQSKSLILPILVCHHPQPWTCTKIQCCQLIQSLPCIPCMKILVMGRTMLAVQSFEGKSTVFDDQ